MQTNKTIAIIGAGPSGLLTAKECLANGLSPKIFEQASGIGGQWNPETGSMWPSMKTNLSRYTCTFSDFPWPEIPAEFPSQREVFGYLNNYCDHFSLRDLIHLNTTVIKAKQLENKWQVTYRENTEEKCEEFDFLVVASGVLSLEHYPNIPGKENFQGKISHSLRYRGPETIEGNHVAVIGGSFSGSEIAADLARGGKMVTSVLRDPMWMLPRYLTDPSLEKKEPIPMDLMVYKRGYRMKLAAAPADIVLQKKHEYFRAISGQEEICPELKVSDFTKPTRIAITDDYLKMIKEGKIAVKKGDTVSFDSTGINFADGSHEDVDNIIFATGYLSKFPYFEQETLEKLCYDPKEQFQPVLLYKCTFHPDIKNLSFVGIYRGTYFGPLELQARWTARIFSGKVELPSREVMMEGIQSERNLKEMEARPQFPHGDYIGLCDSIAEEIDVMPDLKRMEQEEPELYEKLMNYSFVPAHYRLRGFGEKKDVALKQINEVVALIKGEK